MASAAVATTTIDNYKGASTFLIPDLYFMINVVQLILPALLMAEGDGFAIKPE